MFNHFFYVYALLFFILPAAGFVAFRNRRMLKNNKRLVVALVIASLLFTPSEYFALKWGAWFYHTDKVINFRLGAEIESYIFGAAVAILVGTLTLAEVEKIDRRMSRR